MARYIDGLQVAMLGTTDGGFIDADSEIPAGEMYRLAAEYVEPIFERLHHLHRPVTGPGHFYGDKDAQVCVSDREGWPCGTFKILPTLSDSARGDS